MKRLIKVAKELNVGISTIVEHLNGAGFPIESKPTAKVTDQMYNELLNKFERSIAIKEKADKLIIGTRPVAPKETPVSPPPAPPPPPVLKVPVPIKEVKKVEPIPLVPTPPPAPKAVEEEVKKEVVAAPKEIVQKEKKKEIIPPKVEEKAKVEEEVKVEKKETPKEHKATLPKLKVLGKINLDKDKKKPEKKKEAPKPIIAKEEKKEGLVKEVVEKKEKIAKVKKDVPTTPVAKVPTPKHVPKETTSESATPTSDKKEDEGDRPATAKPTMIRAKTPELRGLKILGKIDTDKFKPAKKKKTNTTGGNANSDKRRRRRRKKVVTTGSDSRSTTPNSTGTPKTGTPRTGTPRTGTPRTGSAGGTRSGTARSGTGTGAGARGRRGTVNRRGSTARGGRRDEVKEITKKEIEEKLKATLARIQGSGGKGKKRRQKLRRGNRERNREREEQQELEKIEEKLELTEFISVSELASLLDIEVSEVIMTCMNLGVMVSINQRLDAEIIELVAGEFGRDVEFISVEEQADDEVEEEDDPADLIERSPIVTVMGHVDHGKTSLLDYIREAAVADGEAGGITQHIGAYEVSVDGRNVTFLDTPGHEAFTAMRARGAKVTDIAIIIIAADDNIMPQTKEAISHAQAADVPMIFAINKIDKEGAQPERIKQELANMNLLIEEWGGKYQSQEISAKTGENIELLIEKVLLEAELLELQANPDRNAVGAVLEASLDKGKGYVTKMLVQNGTLEIGDAVLSGEHSGKIKAMYNERGERVKAAGPSTPVMILGLSGAPQAGERFKVLETETEARQIASKRARIVREQTTRATKRLSLDEIGRRLALGSFKELNLIVKGDMDGSIEALSDALIKLSVETVQVNIIHKAVGQVIESDIMLAAASDAIIVAFQVRPSLGARQLADREGVEVRTYSVIYQAIDEVKMAIEGLLEPIKEEKVTGQVEVREVYKISKVGTIAGCFVREGVISRNSLLRVIRNGIVVYPLKEGVTGEISSLKRFKDDAKEVKSGLECGLSVKNFNDIKAEDVIEAYEIVEIKQTLK